MFLYGKLLMAGMALDGVVGDNPTERRDYALAIVAPNAADLQLAQQQARAENGLGFIVLYDEGAKKKVHATPIVLKGGESAAVQIGRNGSNDVVLSDAAVSGSHCQVYFRGDDFYVEHRSKTNKTVVNGTSVVGEKKLASGDKLALGDSIGWFYRI
jgi:hypothetical protein